MRPKFVPPALSGESESPFRRLRFFPRASGRAKVLAFLRVAFGCVWAVAAWLKWQPQFQNSFVSQVASAKAGQPAAIQAWITWWENLVSLNPLLFARLAASLETALAVCLIVGVLSNLTNSIGLLLALGIWTVPEGFGGPYIPGQSTDVGTALPYALFFGMLLLTSAGRYYGVDQWLTPRLGPFGFLASGRLRVQAPEEEGEVAF